jgi:glycosyltransferase involved in cell wall biosynthesis
MPAALLRGGAHLDGRLENRENMNTHPETNHVDMLRDHRVSVLIPCLNEEKNLPYVLSTMPSWVHEIVIIDDHCTDATVDVARRLKPDAVIVRNEAAPGKGNALRAGMRAASGDILVQVDADGSEDPAEISAFVGALLTGADYAKGSRFVQGGGTSDMPRLRRFGNWLLTLLARALFPGTRFSDLCYGYNAYWASFAPLLLNGAGFEIEAVMNIRAVRAGLRISEVPSFEAERIHGVGNLVTFPDGWRVLKAILRERRAPAPAAPESGRRRELSPAALAAREQVAAVPAVLR